MANNPPFVLTKNEQAFRMGSAYLLPSPEMLPGLSRVASPVTIERTMFAFNIPYLPDFLTSPHLTGATERERLAEVLEGQARFISNLAKWKRVGFAIRYFANPRAGTVRTTFVVRMLTSVGAGQKLGLQLARDVVTLLKTNDLPSEPVAAEQSLLEILEPFPKPTIVEIRQREDVVPLRRVPNGAYVVYPLRPSVSTWIRTFRTFLGQETSSLISIYLEPTELTNSEQNLLAEAASIAGYLSDSTYEGLTIRAKVPDPAASLVERIYTNFLQRLIDPFLLVTQVASPNQVTSMAVAQTLAGEITEATVLDRDAANHSDLPTGVDLVSPSGEAEYQIARHMLSSLDLEMWGNSEATEGKERLRYLVEARSASSVFRFPIALRGGISGVKTVQIIPGREATDLLEEIGGEDVKLGLVHGGGLAKIKVGDLNQHALIVGSTRRGKTNTCLSILAQIWREHGKPFLVIEPQKTEYRGLIAQPGFERMLVFTLGDETVSPFRLNPFELLPGVRLESHIGALRTCFDAALPQFGVLPILIEESIHSIYKAKGWELTDRGSEDPGKLFPTMGDMYEMLGRTVEKYAGELKQNLHAAASKRIGSLLTGSKGRMFNTQHSVPFDLLVHVPIVLELNSLNDSEKALSMMFLLTALREHCERRRGRGLEHVTLIEEAHRVMSGSTNTNNPEIAANTEAETAQAFAAVLAEIGAYGEGILIAEQSPSKLVRDAIANTNLKIAHTLLDRREREVIASAMIMDSDQEDHLARLERGQAAFFTSDSQKANFMIVPNYKADAGFDDRLQDDVVVSRMSGFQKDNPAAFLPFDGCRYCTSQCLFRTAIEPKTKIQELTNRLHAALMGFETRPQPIYWGMNWEAVARVTLEVVAGAPYKDNLDAQWCYLSHKIDFAFTEHMRRHFVMALEQIGEI